MWTSLDGMSTLNPIPGLLLLGILTSAASTGCRARPAEHKMPLAGCLSAIERSEAGKFQGFLTSGREEQAFIPCDCDEAWWVKYNKVTVGRVRAANRNNDCYQTFDRPGCQEWMYVELSGVLSPAGQYGHMGGYHRELRVDEIHRLSQDVPSTCEIRRMRWR